MLRIMIRNVPPYLNNVDFGRSAISVNYDFKQVASMSCNVFATQISVHDITGTTQKGNPRTLKAVNYVFIPAAMLC